LARRREALDRTLVRQNRLLDGECNELVVPFEKEMRGEKIADHRIGRVKIVGGLQMLAGILQISVDCLRT
jgi:hypothetical protein